jgi:hypothetical protein
LNRQGIEFYSLQKYQSSLFYFNEAFRLVVSRGSQLLDSNINLQEAHDMVKSHSGALFRQGPDFLQPQDISDSRLPKSMADVETWILSASLKLLINGALGYLTMDKPTNAKKLMDMALNLIEDEWAEDATLEDEEQSLRRKYYDVQMVLLTVHFLMGQVKEKMFKSCNRTQTSEGLEEAQLRSCLESMTVSLWLSEELLGARHYSTAGIYASIGRLLMREGVVRGASSAFQSAGRIYNTPQASLLEGVRGDNPKLTDLAFSSLMLGNTRWSCGAAMA